MKPARLGDVAESMKNGMYKHASEYGDDGIPCLRMYNIDAGGIVWRDIKRMRVSGAEREDYGLREGDLLVNRVNSRELVGKTASDWLAVTGQVLFPAAVAIWITYVNIESTSFGDYLRYQGAARVFHFVFIYPSLVFFVTTVSLIVVKGTKFQFMTDFAVFLLAYCVAVFLVMVLNVATVMRLYGAFRMELEKDQRRSLDARAVSVSEKSNA